MKNITKPYIIGETAFHHEGDKEFALDLIKHAEDLGLDAIKFHITVDLDNYMVQNHEAIDIIRPWCFSEQEWDEILVQVSSCDIVLLCNEPKSMEYALNCSHDIKAVEIHATGLNDLFLLQQASKFKGTVILGTGGSSLDEIDFAINYLKDLGKEDLFLMHGFQNYPTEYKDIKLGRMRKLAELFNLPVGYADHTDPANEHLEMISTLGVASGFNVLEKHFTHKYGEKRIDSQSAVSLEQMKKIKKLSKICWEAIGASHSLVMTEAEMQYGNTGPLKKAIVAKTDISIGDEISLENITYKRTNESSSIKQNEIHKLLGNKANKPIKKDTIIDLSNVDFSFKLADNSQFKNNK